MHPTEPKDVFIIMRGNGWSLGKISNKLGVPKSTLFHWESEAETRRSIDVYKSVQLEKLQEKYIPSFEEELGKLAGCLARVEHALEKHDFETLPPQFLLRTSLQLRSRLHKLRSDVQPSRTLHEAEPQPLPVPGCISRSLREIPDLEEVGSPSPLWGEGRGEVSDIQGGTKRDENQNSGKSDHSTPATSNEPNGTIVPFSAPPDSSAVTSTSSPSPNSSPSPLWGEGRGEVSSPPLGGEVPHTGSQNGTKPNENANPSKPEHSTPATSNNQNGTTVPFSSPHTPGRERYGDLAVPLPTIADAHTNEQIALTAGFPAPETPAQPSRNPKLARRVAEALRQVQHHGFGTKR